MIVVDSAFKLQNAEFLIKSSQIYPDDPQDLLHNRQAISVCQLSKWEMRRIQGKFPRLKDEIKYEEEGDRK